MPIIETLGLPGDQVRILSHAMVEELALADDTPREYFSLWERADRSYVDGVEQVRYPLIFVQMFAREQAIKDRFAAIITSHVQALGYAEVDVIFRVLEKHDYYENGEHF